MPARPPRNQTAHSATLLLLIPVLTGCGASSDLPVTPTYPVEAPISFQGKLIPGAFVAFHPVEPRPEVPTPRASIDRSGALKVSTYRGGDGAPEGDYVLTVQWNRPLRRGADLVIGPNVIPKKYASPRTSGIKVHIAAGENRLPAIRL